MLIESFNAVFIHVFNTLLNLILNNLFSTTKLSSILELHVYNTICTFRNNNIDWYYYTFTAYPVIIVVMKISQLMTEINNMISDTSSTSNLQPIIVNENIKSQRTYVHIYHFLTLHFFVFYFCKFFGLC